MAMTLTQMKEGMSDKVAQQVVDIFRCESETCSCYSLIIV